MSGRPWAVAAGALIKGVLLTLVHLRCVSSMLGVVRALCCEKAECSYRAATSRMPIQPRALMKAGVVGLCCR